MPALTVDTQILMFASDKGNKPDRVAPARTLLEVLEATDGAGLVLDHGFMIYQEYRDKLSDDSFAWQWLGRMITDQTGSKVEWVERVGLPDRARVPLEGLGFHREDMRFASAAHQSESGHLVAEEKHYSSRVKRVLRRELDVYVLTAEEGTILVAP